jgi:class 3 adenylate cyclase
VNTLPSGTVTFLFTDIEGSTRLLNELGAKGYADALAEHRRVIREACKQYGGVEVDTVGTHSLSLSPLRRRRWLQPGRQPGPWPVLSPLGGAERA